MIDLERPPISETRVEWANWFVKVHAILTALQVPVKTNATRGDPGQAGRVIFNEDDGKLNVDNGTAWTLPDGTAT